MYTNSHTISPDTFQQGVISIPDKYSFKEEQRRRNGYRLRLYWQFKESLEKNKATVFFDTLTYDDAHLPRIKDYLDYPYNDGCFCPHDYKSFVDRLRSKLRREGIDNKFKVFLSSEYGSSSYYIDYKGNLRRGTHRPHYHILFFFEKPINTFDLAWWIYDCWQCGITDSVHLLYDNVLKQYFPYLRESRIVRNTFKPGNTNNERVQRLANYVSKYVLKDVKYSKKVDKLVYEQVCKKYPVGRYGVDKKCFQHDVNELRSKIAPFIRISHGFGTYFLAESNLDMDLIYKRSAMRIPDKKYIWKYITIPTFYLRKLFYKLIDGKWVLNDEGKKYMPYHLSNRSQRLANIYTVAYLNSDEQTRHELDVLLEGRDFKSLANYVTYYKGRIYKPALLDSFPQSDFVVKRFVSDPEALVPSVLSPCFHEYFQNEVRTFWVIDDDYYHTGDTKFPYLVDHRMHFSYKTKCRCRRKEYQYQEDWHEWIIDDSWFECHYGFDSVLEKLHSILYGRDNEGQYTYDFKKQYQLDLFNSLGIKSDVS